MPLWDTDVAAVEIMVMALTGTDMDTIMADVKAETVMDMDTNRNVVAATKVLTNIFTDMDTCTNTFSIGLKKSET
jgi:hypothetical protein